MVPISNQYFDAFPARQEAVNDFIKAVGQAKLNVAQSQVQQALAASEFERAWMLQTLVAQLTNDLYDLNYAKASAAARVNNMAAQAHAANMLIRGEQISDYGHSRDAYKHFEMNFLAESPDSIDDELFAKFYRPDGIDFLDNNDLGKACETPYAEQLNALQLIDWMLHNRYIPRSGSEAQRRILVLFGLISRFASDAVLHIRSQTDAIAKGTYEVWQPVALAGIQTAAEKSIATATIPAAK